MHACDMTVTYQRSRLSTCSVVWLPVKYFFLKFIIFLVQLCKMVFQKLTNHTSYPLFQGLFTLPHLSLECVSVALVCDLKFWTINDDF